MPGPLGIGGGGGGSGGTVTTPVFPFIDRAVAQTIGDTGVQSLTAGTGISVSGTTTPTVTNSGVTSIVAGTNVTVSGATGAVTINAPAFATPGSSAIGDTAAAGTATTVSRSDHVHGREAAGTPGASAVGDTASAGVATTVARSDHRHSREAFGTPVNIDASLTSLSAGSLTTVARADHVHTVSKVPVLLASTKLNSNQASVTFSNIPQTFTHLQVYIHARTTVTGGPLEELMIRVNGDTGSNYYGNSTTTYLYGLANTASAYPTTGAVTFTAGVGMIYNYANILGSYAKMWTVLGTCAGSTTALVSTQFLANSTWNSTAAVTSISFASSIGGSLVTGSLFELIGIP